MCLESGCAEGYLSVQSHPGAACRREHAENLTPRQTIQPTSSLYCEQCGRVGAATPPSGSTDASLSSSTNGSTPQLHHCNHDDQFCLHLVLSIIISLTNSTFILISAFAPPPPPPPKKKQKKPHYFWVRIFILLYYFSQNLSVTLLFHLPANFIFKISYLSL